jgi:hypothetical protein
MSSARIASSAGFEHAPVGPLELLLDVLLELLVVLLVEPPGMSPPEEPEPTAVLLPLAPAPPAPCSPETCSEHAEAPVAAARREDTVNILF